MTAPTLRVIHPDDDGGGPEFLELPTQPAPTPPDTRRDVPPLDWAGVMRVPMRGRTATWEIAGPLSPFLSAVFAMAATGDYRWMMGTGIGVAIVVMKADRIVTRGNRWSTTARPPQGGRRRTDEERLRDMADTAGAPGTEHCA